MGTDVGNAFLMAAGMALAGLLGSIPILLLMRWWSEGYISGAEAIGLILVFVMLFGLLMGPIPMASKGVVFLLLAACSVGMPYIVATFAKRDTKRFESEKEDMFRQAVEANPRNIAARGELARNLYMQKRLSEAIEEMEQAVKLAPQVTENEQYLLKNWIRERDAVPNEIAICRWCRQDTPSDRPFCIHCNRPISARREIADAVISDMPRTIRQTLFLLPLLLIAGLLMPVLGTLLGNILILSIIVGGMLWLRTRV